MSEPVSIDSVSMRAWFDPDKHQLYVDHPTTVSRGALVTVRGAVRRVTEVAYWNGAGTVCDLEPGPVYFPDVAEIIRYAVGVRDPVTGVIPRIPTTVYDGPCLIEVEASMTAFDRDVMDRKQELVRYTVKLPLAEVDLRRADEVTASVSRDPRLIGRTLYIDRVLAESHAQERVALVAERQV